MSELKVVRTSLEVGFGEGGLPHGFEQYRGRVWRAIPRQAEFPFDDAQFEVVMMASDVVGAQSVREAHRVLKPDGRLYFCVPEQTRAQAGMTVPGIYQIVREGYNIVSVQRPRWWFLRRTGRTLTICAVKKRWRSYQGFVRDGSLPFSPFRNRK